MSWNPFKRRITSDGTVPPVHPSSPADDTKQTDEDTMADPAKTDEKTKAADPVTPAPPPSADDKNKDDPSAAPTADKAASVSELKLAFADDPAFCLEAVEKKWSLQQAKAERHDRLAAEHSKLKKSVAKLGEEGTGHAGVGAADSKSASREHQAGGGGRIAKPLPSDPYLARIETLMREKNISRGEATRMVNRESPELRHAYAAPARA